jgi:replicative DNA helicase
MAIRNLTPEELAKLDALSDPEVVKSKFTWDDTFQRKLLGMILTDSFMLIQSLDKIKPEYFANEAHVLICRILFDYFQKHKNIPGKWIIDQELVELLKDRDNNIKLHYKSELHAVYDYYIPGLDAREYLIDKVTYFAKVQAVKMAFHNVVDKMNEKPEDEETWSFVYEQMRNAMLVDRNYEPGLEYFLQLDEMYRRMQDVFQGKDRFTTAFPSIDNALTGGGLFHGQIGAWIALPGVGKSLALTRAAVANVLLGHKVLYLTMELNEVDVAQRFTSQFTKLDINNLLNVRDEVYKTVEEFKSQYEDPNLLHIKQFPGGQLDVNGIRSYVSQLELRKWKPGLIIVDYVGEMKDDPALKKYESAYRILRDLRGYGVEKQHCTLTCVQPNSSAAKLEIGEFIDESNIGTSFDQFKPLDALWSINQQVTEKDAEVGRAFVIKHRNGRSRFAFNIGFDYEMGTLDVFEIARETYRAKLSLIQQKKYDDVLVDGKKKNKKRLSDDDENDNKEEVPDVEVLN